MCGLYGIYSPYIKQQEVEWFIELGLHSLARGTDSTGIVVVDKKPKTTKRKRATFNTRWRKDTHNAGLFFKHKKVLKDLATRNKIIMMGHNRHATIGSIGIDEAHPFAHGDIIGMHNGTIHDIDYKPNKTKVSDSDHLFEKIAKEGLEETTQAIASGAFALSYLDTRKTNLYLVRNNKRPLYMVWNKGKTTFMWASEGEFLEYITEFSDEDWAPICQLSVDTLFSIDYKEHKYASEKVVLEKPYCHVGTRQNNYHGMGSGGEANTHWAKNSWRHEQGWTQEDSLAAKAAATRRARLDKEDEKKRNQQLALPAPIHTKDGKETMITYYGEVQTTLKVFEKLLNRGCCYCGSPKDIDDKVHWICSSSYICSDCLSDPQVMYFLNEDELNHAMDTRGSPNGRRILQ